MKFKGLITFVCMALPFSGLAYGQAAHRLGQIIVKGNGIAANVVPYGSVKVCNVGTNCSVIHPVYSDSALTHVLPQPLTADASGNYSYWIAPACVDELISNPGQGSIFLTSVCPSTGSVGTGSVLSVAVNTANGFQGTVTNPTSNAAISMSVDGSHYLPTTSDVSTWNSKQSALGFTPENIVNKNTSNGYAGLTAGTLLLTSEFPAFTGDITTSAGSVATTLATVNSSPGLCGDATHVCAVTTNGKGLVTSQTATPISSMTSVSVGNLSPLFTSSVANPTTTPAISFTQSPAPINSVFAGAPSGTAVAPTFQTAPTFSAANLTNFPLATTSVFGVFKPDGTTITCTTGVCSAAGGSSLPSGTTNQMLYYAASGTTVTPLTLGTNLSITGGVLNASATAATNFDALTSGTNVSATMTIGTGASLGTSGSGTIAATSVPFSGLTGSAPTWNQNTTGTAANLSGTPALPNGTTATTQTVGDNSTKLATTAFVLANGSMIYPGAGIPVSTGTAWGTSLAAPTGAIVGTTDTQTLTNKTVDGVTPATFGFLDPTSSVQTQLNSKAPLASPSLSGVPTAPTATVGTNTTQIATTAFVLANGSSYTLPQATTSVLGGVKCDGTTITCTSGVIAAVGGGSGNTTSTSLTTNAVPKANGANSIINSLLSDDGTTATYTGTGGISAASFTGTGTTPAALSLPAGTGSISALPANSAGFAAPATGGTSYLIKFPATVTAGIPHYAAPATADGVNESAMTISGIAVADLTATGTPSSTTYLRGDNTWATVTASVTFPWSCQPGLGDGLNAITAGTYLQTSCYNDTGQTVTLTGIKCYADAGTPTMNVTNGAGTGLLTGAVTCTTSFAAGTQSATTTLAAGDYLKFTFVAGGTAKQSTFVVTGTHP